MCSTKLSSLVGQQGTPKDKKVTIRPCNGPNFKGKVSSVDRMTDNAIVIDEAGLKRSVKLSTNATSGW